MIFADALPTSTIVPENAVTIVIVFGCLLFVLNVGCAVLVVIGFSRRKPPIEAEFATKAELTQLRGELQHQVGAIFGKIDALISSVNHSTNSIQRDMGRIEGSHAVGQIIAEALKK